MKPLRVGLLGLVLAATACGRGPSLDDFLPPLPRPTGEPQSVWAGPITPANPGDLIAGPAAQGRVGDFYLRNSRARFVIQAPTRTIGVVPPGGNVIDIVPRDGSGRDAGEDHFGELSMLYVLGRTCDHQDVEIVRDGSGGGAAAIVVRGVAAANDFINLRGLGLFSVPTDLDPEIDDGVECATTYILAPDSPTLHVHWSLFNRGDLNIDGPFAAFSDTGGATESWAPTRGFERLGLGALAEASERAPVDYVVYQGPRVAYGLIPRHRHTPATSSTFLVSGVSVVLYGGEKLLDILNTKAFYLHLPRRNGTRLAADLTVGRQAADVEDQYRQGSGEATAPISGRVAWNDGGVAATARVGLFVDQNGNGQIDPGDLVRSYLDAGADGEFAGRVSPGEYLLRADVPDQARSAAVRISLPASGASGLRFELPRPVYYDYEIFDDERLNQLIPGKITVLGRNPAAADQRLFPGHDRIFGVVQMVQAIRGTTLGIGDGADEPLALPPGGTYRIIATRGTEWSAASVMKVPQAGHARETLSFFLRKVAPAAGYVASEYHVHQVGSPDSTVLNPIRVATAIADGVEFFATSDHDFVADLQPVVERLGLARYVRTIPGIEVTPFVYGHFNAWPLAVNNGDASGGAIDWARGTAGYAMIPAEIFAALRERGAQVIQISHPRSTVASDFQHFFDRAELSFDYAQRMIDGDFVHAPVPNSWLRLPETSLWDDSFNALEVWNGFTIVDSDSDGAREVAQLDLTLRDWFNFLSFGFEVAPIGNSDTHSRVRDPMGMPRTYVRVGDDSPLALETGSVIDDVLDTLAGRVPRDVVVSNGPHITVTQAGSAQSVLGRVLNGQSGSVTLRVVAIAADWAPIDTIEVFANATPQVGSRAQETALQPLLCFTAAAVPSLPCARAVGGARPLAVNTVVLGTDHRGTPFRQIRAEVDVTVTANDIATNRPPLASGGDAWLVVRARGNRAVFPLLLDGLADERTLDTFVAGSEAEQEAILAVTGVPAMALTSPIYVDFDSAGYRAIFSPN